MTITPDLSDPRHLKKPSIMVAMIMSRIGVLPSDIKYPSTSAVPPQQKPVMEVWRFGESMIFRDFNWVDFF